MARFEVGEVVEVGRPMAVSELEGCLDVLGWGGVDLALRISVTPKQVSKWRTGKVRIPGAVAAYLRLAVQVRRIDV